VTPVRTGLGQDCELHKGTDEEACPVTGLPALSHLVTKHAEVGHGAAPDSNHAGWQPAGLALEIKAVRPFPGAPLCSFDTSPSSSHTTGFSTHSTALPIFLGRTRTTTTSSSFTELQRSSATSHRSSSPSRRGSHPTAEPSRPAGEPTALAWGPALPRHHLRLRVRLATCRGNHGCVSAARNPQLQFLNESHLLSPLQKVPPGQLTTPSAPALPLGKIQLGGNTRTEQPCVYTFGD